ncbi:MAG: T9SS type A sorting domain-containing protein [bacterium]|nr:T9SS type A sorting domain-containing protein [bacterium]
MVNITVNENTLPKKFALEQNYPNPFNPSTNLRFNVSSFGFVALKIYDLLGTEVATLSIIGIYNCSICEDGPDNIILDPSLPTEYSLYQNYPNPFNPETNIKFDLPEDNFVTIKVYDILGKELFTLLNDFRNAGRYSINFNGSNFASGIYYYKIKAGEFESIKKMILLK